MNQEQRAAMRKLAEEATPGPWWHGECNPPDGHALAWMGQSFVDCEGGRKNYAAPSRDAEYIAAANPSAILQLLDYIETLEKEAARYRWLRDTCMDDPKTRLAVMNGFIDYETVDYIYGKDMDVAIDAAMQ